MQRLGVIEVKRPKGKLIWMHAASVGESMVAVTLTNALNSLYPDINFLITTGTLSSAKILETSLPANATHQFVPLDNIIIIKRFLSHWKPNLGIFIESEFWPCLVNESAKKFNIIVVNARLSDRSFNRWMNRKKLFNKIIAHFKLVATQSVTDLKKYQALGCEKAINLGNLKFANKELEVDRNQLKKMENIFQNKQVFVASSTHTEDEEVTLQIIQEFKKAKIDYYPIIVLRHPERRNEISKKCRNLGLSFTLRSQNNLPSLKDDLYIGDSFGELGLFYSLSKITFIGGSFKRGGHNLVEPAYFDNIIILGPDMSNFQNIATEMIQEKCAIQISDKADLAKKLLFFLDKNNKKTSQELIDNARKFVDNRERTLDNYLKEIKKFL
ncbi:MAG: 3-deoxy-D-manno-octulosonic acid transferase [Rickettsiaceae bacterium]|nr:3-deoxy-D-manno-octulosonic acid transferase [Rickettsiaceae bacterium]